MALAKPFRVSGDLTPDDMVALAGPPAPEGNRGPMRDMVPDRPMGGQNTALTKSPSLPWPAVVSPKPFRVG